MYVPVTDPAIIEEALSALWLAERRVAQIEGWRGATPTANKIGRLRKRLAKATFIATEREGNPQVAQEFIASYPPDGEGLS